MESVCVWVYDWRKVDDIWVVVCDLKVPPLSYSSHSCYKLHRLAFVSKEMHSTTT